jgi:16S rRNA (uracil1498-N3)-methyltransferase
MPLHFLLDDPAAGDPTPADASVGDILTLRGPEAHHAAVVRRVRVGEAVSVGDGRGVWLDAECTAVQPKEVAVTVVARRAVAAPSPRIVLVQALAKGDRDELAVQTAVELGVDEIVPWQASRSVSRWDAAKAEKGRARWAAISREAAKQSHRAWLPSVSGVATTAGLAARATTARMIVLDPTAGERLTALRIDPADDRDVVLVVGPEGGVSEEELDVLHRAGATLAALGETVLRTSTAGPAAIAVVSAAIGRW